jgi:GNAT superfamily N-acetyltransferase
MKCAPSYNTMMNGFSVRAARPADHRALAGILAELLGREDLGEALATALNTNLLKFLSHPGTTLLLAEADDGTVLGFVSLWSRWGVLEDAPTATIDRLLIRPDPGAKAVAFALLEQALGASQALGCTLVEFSPSEDSAVPEEALARFGFKVSVLRHYTLDLL